MPVSLNFKWLAIGLVALLAGFAIYFVLQAFEDRGALKEREAIVNQNKEAGNAGENARLNLHECLSRGLQFNYETGQCR